MNWTRVAARLRLSLTTLAALAELFAPACKSPSAEPAPSVTSTAAASATLAASAASAPRTPAVGARGVRVVDAPADGPVDAIVKTALDGARLSGETLLVYVGATWCEPCQRFHAAAARGELDAQLPKVELLTFDLDRDRERLVAAGYVSRYIPLFALPGPSGAASGKQVEGGVKGDGAVGFIVPRLQAMLSE